MLLQLLLAVKVEAEKRSAVFLDSQGRTRSDRCVLLWFELGALVSNWIPTTFLLLYYSLCLRTVMLGKCLIELGSYHREPGHAF